METDAQFLEQRLKQISRELLLSRCLLLFVTAALAFMLFAPRQAAAFSEKSQALLDWISQYSGGLVAVVLSLALVILCAAYVIARLAPKPASFPKTS